MQQRQTKFFRILKKKNYHIQIMQGFHTIFFFKKIQSTSTFFSSFEGTQGDGISVHA